MKEDIKENKSDSFFKRAADKLVRAAYTVAQLPASIPYKFAAQGTLRTYPALYNGQPTKRLVFLTPGVENTEPDYAGQVEEQYFPGAKILRGAECETKDSIVTAIKNHVVTGGTLDEIVIEAHAAPNKFSPSGTIQKDCIVKMDDFLDALVKIQADVGVPLARRIVFTGCNLFTNLNQKWIDYYRETSGKLMTELAGPTSEYEISAPLKSPFRSLPPLEAARMVCFKPDGQIVRDIYDQPQSKLAQIGQSGSAHEGYTDEWFNKIRPQKGAAKSEKSLPGSAP